MSKGSRIKKSNELLIEAEQIVASIGGGSSNISIGSSQLLRLHKKLDDSIDALHTKQHPCCPVLMKKLKTYRLFIKRCLTEQSKETLALA